MFKYINLLFFLYYKLRINIFKLHKILKNPIFSFFLNLINITAKNN